MSHKRDNKNFRSQVAFNPNKVVQNDGRSLEELLGDISVPSGQPTRARESNASSFMMIEVSDMDIVPSSGGIGTRAQTSNMIGGVDMSLNIEPVINTKTGVRYGQGMRNNNPSTIVANARKELETMQRSELPRSRMSVANGEGLPKLHTTQFNNSMSKLQGISRHASSIQVKSMKSLHSVAGTANSSQDRIAVYRNDEERQSMMKLLGDQ